MIRRRRRRQREDIRSRPVILPRFSAVEAIAHAERILAWPHIQATAYRIARIAVATGDLAPLSGLADWIAVQVQVEAVGQPMPAHEAAAAAVGWSAVRGLLLDDPAAAELVDRMGPLTLEGRR